MSESIIRGIKIHRYDLLPGRLLSGFILSFSVLAVSCEGGAGIPDFGFSVKPSIQYDPYYITGPKAEREAFRQLFAILAGEKEPGESQFTVVREIANRYVRLKEYGKLINFLTSQIQKNPDNSYNTYYLFMTAYGYLKQEADAVAALYFDLILKNYPDLLIQGQSIHLACLNQLIALRNNPEQQVQYYEELIARFSEKIDLGSAYFMLAQGYEQTGEWNKAIQSYTSYLPYRGTSIPGFPEADQYAKQLVDFNKSPKDWTFENLNALVNAIKGALEGGNIFRLRQCQAKVNFFARSWAQENTDDSGMVEFSLSPFMSNNQIRYANTLDRGSNANEAYLRTSGWDQYITTWYLYFRKIYFPLDPDIHGRWEWAGIYYGEKF